MPYRHTITVLIVLLGILLVLQLALGECVQEDAFISFRYARNLARGHGLVYNIGERVEGYSNFLWTVMIAGGMALGLDPVGLARFLGLGASLLLVVATFLAARRLDRSRRVTGGCLAASLVALAPGVIVEGVQGLETVFYALLITLGVGLAAQARGEEPIGRAPAWRLPAAAGLFTLAALTRPDGLGIFGLVTLGGLAWRARRTGRLFTRDELLAVLAFAVLYVPYWVWRFHYYGYPFPNTYYAKTGGGIWHVLRGLAYVGRFLLYNPVLTLTAVWAVAATLAARRQRGAGDAPSLARTRAGHGAPSTAPGDDRVASALQWIGVPVLLGYLAYVVLVGGDFKQTFRFIVPVLPLGAILLDNAVSRHAAAGAREGSFLGRIARGRRVPAFLLLGVFLNAAVQIPTSSDWVGRRTYDLVRRKACGLYLKSIAAPGDVLAIHSAGIIPYYSELPTIDMWGITNAHIAHLRLPDMGRGDRLIGHEKQDDGWVLSQNPTYFVDQIHVITTRPVPDLVERLFPTPAGREIARRYVPHSVPLQLDLGHGLREYWFNYIALRKP